MFCSSSDRDFIFLIVDSAGRACELGVTLTGSCRRMLPPPAVAALHPQARVTVCNFDDLKMTGLSIEPTSQYESRPRQLGQKLRLDTLA